MHYKNHLVAGTALLAVSLLYTSTRPAQAEAETVAAPAVVGNGARIHRNRLVRRKLRAGLHGASPGASADRVNPNSAQPGALLPAPVKTGPTGPLAPLGKSLEDRGIFVHLLEIETYYNNLNSGIVKNTGTNTAFLIAGADFDMEKLANISGGTVHVQEQIFHGLYNVLDAASRYGGLTSGYEPIFNPTDNQLSVLTYEQTFNHGQIDVEVGRTEPERAFFLPICPNLVSCWNDVIEQDARARTTHTAGWGGRVAYKLSPAWYLQAGAYEDNPHASFEHGFNFGATKSTGAILLGEIGYKTDFTNDKYPTRFEAVGYYNTSPQADPYFSAYGRSMVLNPTDPARINVGNGGVVFDAIKTVWRADGGREDNLHPTALDAYASVSAPVTTGSLVSMEAYAGLTLLAPFQSRPLDTLGAKIHMTQLSGREQLFLIDSNLAAGGTGYNKSRNGFEFELSSHNEIGNFLSVNTTIQYFANNNNFYNPSSAKVSRDGFLFGMDATIPLGQLVGLSTLPY